MSCTRYGTSVSDLLLGFRARKTTATLHPVVPVSGYGLATTVTGPTIFGTFPVLAADASRRGATRPTLATIKDPEITRRRIDDIGGSVPTLGRRHRRRALPTTTRYPFHG
jgi:hypothetical protein